MTPEFNYPSWERIEHLEKVLLTQMKQQLPQLQELLEEINGPDNRCFEDCIYRAYHNSAKVFERSQSSTQLMVAALAGISPEGQPFCEYFKKIIATGTGQVVTLADNDRWPERTRPLIEAYLHAHHLLKLAVKYAQTLDAPPQSLPYGWATLLCLYGIR